MLQDYTIHCNKSRDPVDLLEIVAIHIDRMVLFSFEQRALDLTNRAYESK